MKLPDFLKDARMEGLRSRMRASMAAAFTDNPPVAPIDLSHVLRSDGLDVEVGEIEALSDGTLGYRGHRVIVYIRDVASYVGTPSLPRFHLADCTTLKAMKRAGRFERYVVANRDDGTFLVHTALNVPEMLRLRVCQNCLKTVHWNEFDSSLSRQEKLSRVESFDLKQFFEIFPRDLLQQRPTHTDSTAPLNLYPANWRQISLEKRRAADFTCERCHFALRAAKSEFLDVHHRNGLKNDSHTRNLMVLCVGCHAEEPMHQHLKLTARYSAYLRTKSHTRG